MEKQEQAEWDDLNKLLQQHGFKPVNFSDPVENRNLSDLVLLDKKSAADVRTTMRMMLADSERRQALIQELIKSNNRLKEDARDHVGRAARHSRRVTEAEALLDAVKSRVQDLEDRCLGEAAQQQQQQQRRRLQREQLDAQALEQKLSKQKEDAAQLEKKLYFTVKEEERRLARRSEMFQNICNRVIRDDSPEDQRVLEAIDFYEAELTRMQDELRSLKGEQKRSEKKVNNTSCNVTPPFQSVLRAYQEKQAENKVQMEELMVQVERLKKELETRPTVREMKFHKHKVRLMEQAGKRDARRAPERNRTEVSDRTGDPGPCVPYHQLLSDISQVVTNPGAPFQLHRRKPSAGPEFQTLLPTLEVWAQQLHLLEPLHQALIKLSGRLLPWQSSDGGRGAEAVKVEDMMLLVDTMLEDTSTGSEKVLRSPTRYTLGSMVSHFQKLFDVPTLSGVYPRMNEVYARLGETANAMNSLRDALELDCGAPPTEVASQVARLVSRCQLGAGFHDLLTDADVDSIVVKVTRHDEFFPAFHALTLDIFQTLGVSRLGDVLPALRSLTQTAQ